MKTRYGIPIALTTLLAFSIACGSAPETTLGTPDGEPAVESPEASDDVVDSRDDSDIDTPSEGDGSPAVDPEEEEPEPEVEEGDACEAPPGAPSLELEPSSPPVDLATDGLTFYRDVSYGPHSRNVFDMAMPASDEPTPVLIFIHGGGFRSGDKTKWYEPPHRAQYLLEQGIATATINYRLLAQDGTEDEGVLKSLGDTRRALQFIRRHAADFNLDPDRIGLAGGSAGAGSSLWNGLQDEACDPSAADPVERTSTRVSAIAAMALQSTYDLVRWETDVFGPRYPQMTMEAILDFEPGFYAEMAAFYGLEPGWEDIDALYEEPIVSYRASVDMLAMVDASDPPIFLQSGMSFDLPLDRSHFLHHPLHAVAMYEAATEAGVERVEIQTREVEVGASTNWWEFIADVI